MSTSLVQRFDKAGGGNETKEEGPPSKRSRLEDDTLSASSTPTPPGFLDFHMKLLRSLYSQKEDSAPNDENEEEDDIPAVDDTIWSMAADFLKDRNQLAQSKQEAVRWHGIYKEALAVEKSSSASSKVRYLKMCKSVQRCRRCTILDLATPVCTHPPFHAHVNLITVHL